MCHTPWKWAPSNPQLSKAAPPWAPWAAKASNSLLQINYSVPVTGEKENRGSGGEKLVFSEQQFELAKYCDRQSAYTQSGFCVFKHQLLENNKVLFSTQEEEQINFCILLSTSIIA